MTDSGEMTGSGDMGGDQTRKNGPTPRRDPSRGFWIAVLLIFVGVVVARLFGSLVPVPDRSADHLAVGRDLARLQLQSLGSEGRDIQLADLRGKVVLLNFWGTWCGPCVQEVPHLARLARRFQAADDFRLLAVSCGPIGLDDDLTALAAQTQEFLDAARLQLPSYADQNAVTRMAVLMAMGHGPDFNFSYPTTLLLDRTATIRGVWQGYQRQYPEQMANRIEALLADNEATISASK